MTWRKSTFSIGNGECVEVADGPRVRDTEDREGAELALTAAAWTAFVAGLKGGAA